jgi:glucose/arabinose dehydrogenase
MSTAGSLLSRSIQVALQLALVAVAVYVATAAAPRFDILIGPLRGSKNAPLRPDEFAHVLRVMTSFHGLLICGSLALHRRSAFDSPKRFMTELYVAMVATSLGACWLFVLTIVPFSPNFYAQVYVLIFILYALAFGMIRMFSHRETASGAPFDLGDALRRAVSPPFLGATLIILMPGILAVVYKKVENFANAVNSTRARMNISTEEHWVLVPVLPDARFEQPMWLEFDRSKRSRFFTLSRPGRLYVYELPSGASDLLLDLSKEVGSVDAEMGALSFALHPRFGVPGAKERGYVYISYTAFQGIVVNRRPSGRQWSRLARFDISLPTQAERDGSQLMLVDQERVHTGQHNGSTAFFGPEGYLYFTIGDLMNMQAQSVGEQLSGGVFRIDVDQRGGDASGPILVQPKQGKTANYFVPKDNPWYGEPAALGEFWALGFRNPFRASIDPATGDIWLGDVGHDSYEEINRVSRGSNGQWPYFEGMMKTHTAKPTPLFGVDTPPVFAYPQTALDRAVLGGFLYRGSKYPALAGKLVFADNNSSTVKLLDPKDADPKATPLARAGRMGQQGITAVIPAPDGGIWITALGGKLEVSGEVLELVPARDAPLELDTKPVLSPSQAAESKFSDVCSRCHGYDGRGNPQLSGVTKRPDFATREWQDKTTDERIRNVILRGGAALGLAPDMPAWQGFLSDSELEAMVKKIRAFGASAQPAAADAGTSIDASAHPKTSR